MSTALSAPIASVMAGLSVVALVVALERARELDRSGRARRRLQARSGPGAAVPTLRRGLGPLPGPKLWTRFEERCARRRLPAVLREPLAGVGLTWDPEVVAAAAASSVIGASAATALIFGAGAAVLTAVAAALGATATLALCAGRADRIVDRDLPAVLDRISASLRAGATLSRAVTEAAEVGQGPLRADLDRIAARLAAGETVGQAVDAWRHARQTPAVATTAAAMAIAHQVGGGAARAVDGVAASLRDRASVQREVIALSTQARASALVIVLAPLGFGLFTGVADQQTWSFLTATPVGLACLTGGVLLDLSGGLWMAWLARSVARS